MHKTKAIPKSELCLKQLSYESIKPAFLQNYEAFLKRLSGAKVWPLNTAWFANAN